MFVRPDKGTRGEEEYMYTDGSSTNDNYSDEIIHYLMMNRVV